MKSLQQVAQEHRFLVMRPIPTQAPLTAPLCLLDGHGEWRHFTGAYCPRHYDGYLTLASTRQHSEVSQ